MLCTNCKSKIPNMSRFCPECGAELTNENTFTNSINKKLNSIMYMKQCVNCQSEIPGDSRFCPECACEQLQRDVEGSIKKLIAEIKEKPELQKKYKILGGVVTGAIALCVVIGILSTVIKPSINLNKYIEISTTGYNTFGNAEVEFDYTKLAEDYEGKVDINEIIDYIKWNVDNTDNLSNGDMVTVSWNCADEAVLLKYDYKLKYSPIEHKVSDLKEAETFDPFEGVEVIFEGISSDGTAYTSVKSLNPETEDFEYYIDKNYALSNGDSVKVYASCNYGSDAVEYCLDKYGKVPSATEKTYTVSGLHTYVESLDEITEDSLGTLQAQAIDAYNAHAARSWNDGQTLADFSYVGSYLLTPKSIDNMYTKNILYLVYKATINSSYTNGEDVFNGANEIYWYIAYSDLIVTPDKELIVDITRYTTPDASVTVDSGISDGWWGTKQWSYYGYDSLESLYRDNVTVNIDMFKCEENIMN